MRPSRAAVIGAYAVAGLLIVIPIIEFTLRVWPLQPGTTSWRFGAIGIFSTTVITPLLGVVVGGAIAFSLEHRSVVRALGVLTLLGSILFLGFIGLFVLDAIEMRTPAQEAALFVFDVTAVQVVLKLTAVFLVAVLLGVGGWRSSRRIASPRGARSAPVPARPPLGQFE